MLNADYIAIDHIIQRFFWVFSYLDFFYIGHMQLNYSVSEKWYQNVYSDKKECRSSARSFSLTHDKRTNECWLLIHGYRGYPGELVRPAEDLFNIGFDVFVPRLPGNGTSSDDFIKTKGKDWITLAQNALDDLSKQYEK